MAVVDGRSVVHLSTFFTLAVVWARDAWECGIHARRPPREAPARADTQQDAAMQQTGAHHAHTIHDGFGGIPRTARQARAQVQRSHGRRIAFVRRHRRRTAPRGPTSPHRGGGLRGPRRIRGLGGKCGPHGQRVLVRKRTVRIGRIPHRAGRIYPVHRRALRQRAAQPRLHTAFVRFPRAYRRVPRRGVRPAARRTRVQRVRLHMLGLAHVRRVVGPRRRARGMRAAVPHAHVDHRAAEGARRLALRPDQ